MSEPDIKPVDLSDVLKNEIVKQWMNEIIQEEKLQNTKITVSSGSGKGDNYLGIIYRIIIEGEHEKQKKSIHLILKEAVKVEGFRNVIPVQKAYQREIFMYKNVLTEFQKLQKAQGCDGLFDKYVTVLRTSDKYLDEFILMKDAKNEGFIMTNRMDTLNYDHAKLVLENLGRFHALTYAMRKHNPEELKRLSNIKDIIQYFVTKEMLDQFKSFIDKAANSLDQENEADLVAKFKDYMNNKMEDNMDMLSNRDTYDEFATICHGDCWSNNILFKYDDQENPTKPTDVCFLDWQVSRYASPVLDISYFIYNCTGTALRDAHFDELMDIYYSSLSDALIKLNCEPDVLFPKKVFDEHLIRFFKNGIHTATMTIFLFVSDSEEIPDYSEMTELNEETAKMMMYTSKNIDLYNERVGGIIRHALQRGYI